MQIWGSSSWFSLLALSNLLSACGNARQADSLPNDAGPAVVPASFDEALAALGANTSSAYSLIFFGESPGVSGLRAMAILGETADACTEFESHFAAPVPAKSALWTLQLTFTGTALGEYQIAIEPPLPSTRPLVSVTLDEWQDGRRIDRFVALGGSVSLRAAAQDDVDWRAGQSLQATIHAEFPEHRVRALGCAVGGEVNGPTSPTTCSCEDDSSTFTCTPTADSPSCCFDYQSKRRTATIELDSQRCANMCDVTSLLYEKNCKALRP